MRKSTDIIGKEFTMNNGSTVRIIEYFNNKNCTILFIETEEIRKNVILSNIQKGTVRETINRVGEIFNMKRGGWAKIISHEDYRNYTLEFNNGYIKSKVSYQDIKNGTVYNPLQPSVCNIGFSDVDSHVSNQCKSVWRSMLTRCYSERELRRYPSYKGMLVCEKWMHLKNFAIWFENNYKKGFHLDKDILIKGNKIYSPETCCFVPTEINSLFTKTDSKRGDCPIGVIKSGYKYSAHINNYGERVYLGTFDTPEEAFQAYKIAKELWIKNIAVDWKEQIEEKVYIAMYNWEVEITD